MYQPVMPLRVTVSVHSGNQGEQYLKPRWPARITAGRLRLDAWNGSAADGRHVSNLAQRHLRLRRLQACVNQLTSCELR